MENRVRHHIVVNVIVSTAFVLALSGGTAQAAVAPTNSVVSSSIKNGEVKTPDRANGAVTNAKLHGGAVTASKVAPDALGGGQIRELSLDVSVLQRRIATACPAGQAIRAVTKTGGVVCQGSSGTVTSVDSGTGLTGGPITSSGTLSIASPFRLPQSCASGQVAKADGSGSWNCAADQDSPTGSAGGALAGTYPNPSLNVSGGPCPNGQALTNVSSLAGLTCKTGVYSDGSSNVGVGGSFPALTTGSNNSALGDGALQAVTSGSTNSAVGTGALGSNTSGIDNSALGYAALALNTNGGNNSAVGLSALHANSSGGSNSAVGVGALQANTTASNNSALGAFALAANTTGANNSAFGQGALDANTTGNVNTAVGKDALGSNTTALGNSALGFSALGDNTTGAANTAVGRIAMDANTTGNENSAFGDSALGSNTTASDNSAFGHSALSVNTTGSDNSAFGQHALFANTTGTGNSVLGQGALDANVDGNSNSAIGTDALGANTTGFQNSAFGRDALDANTTGINNTALGKDALGQNSTGSSNVAIGYLAGTNNGTGDNNIDIGTVGANESNTIRIGTQGSHTRAFVAGVSGTNLGASPGVVVDSNGQLGVNTSSRRFKTDIHPLRRELKGLMRLKPVSFRYKRSDVEGPNPTEFGLLAEQVAKVYPNLVVRGRDHRPYTVLYQQLPALLLAKAQSQQRQLDRQRAQNARQQLQIRRLMRRVNGR